VLDLNALGAGYGKVRILRDVTCRIGKGDIVGIIGRNGVGKTTLMKTIIGLIKAGSGSIRYDGADVTRLNATQRARRAIGYVPQGRGVFPQLTVHENLRVGELIGIVEHKRDYDLIYKYFPILRERANQRAGTMSGGEQQQLSIGRALVGRPKLLLLDEPSEGIQPSIVQQIGENVAAIAADTGLTVLFVEQNLDLITMLAKRCYVIDKGTIIDDINPDELKNKDTVKRYLAV